MTIFAWITHDLVGGWGFMTIQLDNGMVSPAVFTKEHLATRFADQAQENADQTMAKVELVRFTVSETIATMTPRTP